MFTIEVIIPTGGERVYWQVRAANGRIILKSDYYTSYYPARRSAQKFHDHLTPSTIKEEPVCL